MERGALGSGELVGGGVGNGGSLPKLGEDCVRGGGVLAGRAVSGGPESGDERTIVAPSSSMYSLASIGFCEAPGEVGCSSSGSANGALDASSAESSASSAESLMSSTGFNPAAPGAAERNEGGGGNLLDGGGGTLLGVGGAGGADGTPSILPEGGGTNRPLGGGASMRPDGGATSFPIGGMDAGPDVGALGRDEAVSPLRFFSSGKSPSAAGLSLLGEDAVSILNTPRPSDRPTARLENDTRVFSLCTFQWVLGGSFLLSDSPPPQGCCSTGRKCDTWLHRSTHRADPFRGSGELPRCAMIDPWISRRCWKNAGASNGTPLTSTGVVVPAR